jgi:hypothetical protein
VSVPQPESYESVARYRPQDRQGSEDEAYLDPLREAIGRFVEGCRFLEMAIFKVRERLDGVTYAQAESMRPEGCLKRLRAVAADLGPLAEGFLSTLTNAAGALELRHAVVHGLYRRNPESGADEACRYRKHPRTGKLAIRCVVYDRPILIQAMFEVHDIAADLLDGREVWASQLRQVRRS